VSYWDGSSLSRFVRRGAVSDAGRSVRQCGSALHHARISPVPDTSRGPVPAAKRCRAVCHAWVPTMPEPLRNALRDSPLCDTRPSSMSESRHCRGSGVRHDPGNQGMRYSRSL
jgi:hypothetical protein